jgi:CRISPR/Cas system-associated protein Csx1
MRRYVPYLLLLILFSCNSREKEMNEVLAFKEMSELATVEYIVTKIVKAEDNKTWYKIGDRKILLSCEASIKAGIDFSKINEGDVTIDGKSISLVLPKAHLISMNIRPEDVRVEYQETGFFRDEFSTADRDALLTQGEKQIKNSVEALGVLTAAETNASLFISNYLKTLGYNRINIKFSSASIPQLK